MSGSDLKVLNKVYSNIKRPHADVDLSQESWEIVMKIMEQQRMAAIRQTMVSYTKDEDMPLSIKNFECYNGNNSTEDTSDVSSYDSDEMMSDESTEMSSDESDVEIDVDSIDDESDEEFDPSIDIPITVLQLENQIREKDQKM